MKRRILGFRDKFKLFESKDEMSIEVDKIIDSVIDFIDEGFNIVFESASGSMTYQDYVEKNQRYQKFKPVFANPKRVISNFKLKFVKLNLTYNELIEILQNMKSTIGRLDDDGWVLYNFKTTSKNQVKSTGNPEYKEVEITEIEWQFSKPDREVDTHISQRDMPNMRVALKSEFERLGIPIVDIEFDPNELIVVFGSNAYDGELNSRSWYENKFEDICQIFGFDSFNLDYPKATVYFEYSEE